MSTDAFAPGDRRLKILWIEDKPAENLPLEAEIENRWSRIFVIEGRVTPEDVASEFAAARAAAAAGRHSSIYALYPSPYDIILADFRLTEPPGGDPSPAARAPAAGLTIAVLAAFQCPDHPVAIIPYSAWPEEFGDRYQLLMLGWPPTVHVSPAEQKAGPGGKEALLLRASKEYRLALLKSIDAGTCHVPLSEQHRWRGIMQTAESGRLPNAETIHVSTPWGRRAFGIDSLFADTGTAEGIPSNAVADWFRKIPEPHATEQRARDLADLYWRLATSATSRWRYRVAEMIKQGKPLDGLDVSTPPDDVFPPIYHFKAESDSEDTAIAASAPMRLALLFLMIRATAERTGAFDGSLIDPGQFGDPAIRDAVAEYLESGGLHAEEQLKEAFTALTKQLPQLAMAAPLTEVEILRFIDPLPDTWAFKLSLGNMGKIGKELTRWRPALDVKALLRGDGRGLLPSERLSGHRYALEFFATADDIPSWLR